MYNSLKPAFVLIFIYHAALDPYPHINKLGWAVVCILTIVIMSMYVIAKVLSRR